LSFFSATRRAAARGAGSCLLSLCKKKMSTHDKHDDDVISDSVYINLTIPPNAEPGVDSLTFEYNGCEMEVLLPENAICGDVLRIQVGSSAAATNSSPPNGGDNEATTKSSSLTNESVGMEDESVNDTKLAQNNYAGEGVAVVSLGEGLKSPITLHLLERLPREQSSTICNEDGDGTASCLWPSGIVLAQALTSKMGIEYLTSMVLKHTERGRRIECMELGSGLGIGGIALAHSFASINTSSSTQCQIVLTDRGDETIALLRENIDRNCTFEGAKKRISVTAQTLNWGNQLYCSTRKPQKFHLIIGSDLLYNSRESYEPLLQTIQQNLHPDGTVILSVRWRKPDLEREFFHKAEQFGIIFVNWKDFEECETFRSRCPARLNWRAYGNPESECSNDYFHNTNISITTKLNAIVTKSLAVVTEDDMESMKDDEYTIFEEMQIQIYLAGYVAKKGRKRNLDGISSP
jgi:predicted nicotinamide N-methyase